MAAALRSSVLGRPAGKGTRRRPDRGASCRRRDAPAIEITGLAFFHHGLIKISRLPKIYGRLEAMRRIRCLWLYILFAVPFGVSSCGGIQIVSEEKTQPTQVQREEAPPEKKAQKEVPKDEKIQEKSFLGKIFQSLSPQDTFTRVYSLDFRNFHPQVLSSLQDYVKTNRGNSFQVQKLGSDEVIIRGVYLHGKEQQRFSTNLTLKPVGSKKSSLEIKLTPSGSGSSTDNESAAQELFKIIEKGAGVHPQN